MLIILIFFALIMGLTTPPLYNVLSLQSKVNHLEDDAATKDRTSSLWDTPTKASKRAKSSESSKSADSKAADPEDSMSMLFS